VVVQSVEDGAVLMLAWANEEALRRTAAERRAWFWSRSRGALWRKGDTSGHHLDVVGIRWDCDGDAVLYLVRPHGPACHTGAASCFFRGEGAPEAWAGAPAGAQETLAGSLGEVTDRLRALVAARRRALPEGSYVADLLRAGSARALQKLGEEAVEAVIAGLSGDPGQVRQEFADLWFHLLVAMEAVGVPAEAVAEELAARHQTRPARGD